VIVFFLSQLCLAKYNPGESAWSALVLSGAALLRFRHAMGRLQQRVSCLIFWAATVALKRVNDSAGQSDEEGGAEYFLHLRREVCAT